jgi:hypothetical protein
MRAEGAAPTFSTKPRTPGEGATTGGWSISRVAGASGGSGRPAAKGSCFQSGDEGVVITPGPKGMMSGSGMGNA